MISGEGHFDEWMRTARGFPIVQEASALYGYPCSLIYRSMPPTFRYLSQRKFNYIR